MSSAKLKAALIVSLAFNAAVLGTAAARWGSRPDAAESRKPARRDFEQSCVERSRHLAKGIGLCDSKTVFIEREMLKACSAETGIRERIERERDELFDLFRAERPDSQAIMNKVDSISSLQGDLEKSIVRKLMRSHSILDPAERERFMSFIGCGPGHRCVSPMEKCPAGDSLGKDSK